MLIVSVVLFVLAVAALIAGRNRDIGVPGWLAPVLILAGGIAAAASPITVISAGHRGVQVTFGNVNEHTLAEGLHYINPLSSVIEMEARVQREEEALPAETSDTQSVTITVMTNWRPRSDRLAWLYQNYGTKYQEKIIPPALREAVKAEIAKYKVTELIAQRPAIHTAVQGAVNAWLNKYELDVLEVSIGKVDFSPEYDDAIEKKQVQEQQALQKKYELDRTITEAQMAAAAAKGEADSRIAKATGEAESTLLAARAEAESLRIRGEAQADYNRRVGETLLPSLIQSAYLQRWDGKLPVYTLGGATPLVMLPEAGK